MDGPAAGAALACRRLCSAGLLELGLPPSSSEERCQAAAFRMEGDVFSIPMPQMRVCTSNDGLGVSGLARMKEHDSGHMS